MEITSLPFALLAIVSVFLYYLLNNRYRIGYLVLLSCGFIAAFNTYLLFYVVIYSAINYLIGLKIPESKFKKVLFRIGIIFNLTQLVVLKYASFAIDPIFLKLGCDLQISRLSAIVVPIGISFFTLQGIGYLVNINMGWEKPENKYLKFLLYIIFYPKFLSGPIERSNHFLVQLKTEKKFNENQFIEGLKIALFGFFKKIVIANQLGLFVNNVYSDLDSFGGINLWIVILIQPLYLYFDFSGYTDIALGLAKMYGFDLLPNFNRPFLSTNVTTLWRRMHMSLSFWFNDYVFKQLSFRYRRWGKYAAVFAVFITFTLFGIWHGAGWNFMILGFLQALAINYEFFTKKQRIIILSKMPEFYRIWLGRIFTYLFFGISHIFFFSPNITTAFDFFSKLNNLEIRYYLGVPSKLTFILALISLIIFISNEILASDYIRHHRKSEEYLSRHAFLRKSIYYVIIILIISQLGKSEAFIYQAF